jgi:glucokinase
MTYAVGVDIGGTKVAIGLVTDEGAVLSRSTLKTDTSISPQLIVKSIAEEIHKLLDKHSLGDQEWSGLGIGAPGPLDPKNGVITCPPNLPGWEGFRIVEEFRKYIQKPIVMENDATAATLAEKWVGAARENEHFLFMTISTGIGAGLFMDGKLRTGSTGNTGDVGHMVVDPSVGTCICGQRGCFEYVASGTAIARMASEVIGRPVSTKEAFELHQQGNQEMKALVDRVFTYIGMGCTSLINTLDIEKIVIGGGVSQVGEPLFSAVRDYVSRFALNPAGRRTEIVPAVLDQDAGLIGAAALILAESHR